MGISPSSALEDFERSLSTLIDLAIAAIDHIIDGGPLGIILDEGTLHGDVIIDGVNLARPVGELVTGLGGGSGISDMGISPSGALEDFERSLSVIIDLAVAAIDHIGDRDHLKRLPHIVCIVVDIFSRLSGERNL